MAFRNLDVNHDWCFGNGLSDYVDGHNEVALNVKTRILCFLGDCFFDIEAGIDWFNRLEYNQKENLELDLKDVIIKTKGVAEIVDADVAVGSDRKLFAQYTIKDVYSKDIIDEVKII